MKNLSKEQFLPIVRKILEAGLVRDKTGKVTDASGYNVIMEKFDILKEYFANTWNMDIDKLRDVIVRRSAEVKTLNLRTLK